MLTPRRDDARRNRESILREADAVFGDSSDVVSMDEIARRTGLGRATVYRHFSDRHALAAAVVRQNLEALRRSVNTANSEGRSFRDLLHLVLSTQVSMRPLAILLRELPAKDQRQHVATLIGILTPSFRRAQAEGDLREDAEPADLTVIMSMLDAAAETRHAGGDPGVAMQRIISIVLDGLFTQPTPGTGRMLA